MYILICNMYNFIFKKIKTILSKNKKELFLDNDYFVKENNKNIFIEFDWIKIN